jgi:hypothetical protein
MDANEAFEQEAELFYRDTGFLAPGKSESPAACGQTDFERYEVRQLLKRAWDAGRRRPEPPRREAEEECRARIPGSPCVYVCRHCHEVAPDTAALTPAKGKEK